MQFSCTKENLSRGLNIVSRVTSKNINLPILNNVLIDIKNKNLRLLTTNLEIFIICNIRSKIDEEGSFTLPAKLFSDYINLLPEEKIDINLIENDFVRVECKNFKTKFKGISASEFPLTPEFPRENSVKVKVLDIKNLIESVAFAASPNETRPELSGVFFKLSPGSKDGKITAAATDSYRLAEKKIDIVEHKIASEEKSVIIPSKTLQEIHRIISVLADSPESSDVLEIIFGDNQVLFVYDNVEIFSRLIEGNYPEYQHIIPTDFKTHATVNKEELIKAIKVSSLFAKSNLNDVHLEFDGKGVMTVSSAESQIGENNITLDAEFVGEENKIILNYKYLIDGLNMMKTEKVEIKINDDSTPCVIKEVKANEDEDDYTYLVMPIRL